MSQMLWDSEDKRISGGLAAGSFGLFWLDCEVSQCPGLSWINQVITLGVGTPANRHILQIRARHVSVNLEG